MRADFFSRIRFVLLLSGLCALCCAALQAQAQSPAPSTSPKPSVTPTPSVAPKPENVWRVGFLRLAARDLSDAYSFATISVPKTWRVALNEGLRHRVSAVQADALQLELDKVAMAGALRALDSAIDQRDRAMLGQDKLADDRVKALQSAIDKAVATRAAYVDLEPLSDEKKAEIKTRADALRQASAAAPTTNTSANVQNDAAKNLRGGRGAAKWFAETYAPIEMPVAGQETDLYSAIAPEKTVEMRRLAQAQNLQTLVGGRLTESQGYLFLEVFVYDRAADAVVYSDQRAFLPADIETRSSEFLTDIANAVVSYKGSSITVKPTSEVITTRLVGPMDNPVQGRDEGFGTREWRFLEPGQYRLDYFATGYYSDSETLEVAEGGGAIVRTPSLRLAPYPPVHVESVPDGADIFLQSQFMGVTPMDITIPGGATVLLLEKEGFRRSTVLVDSEKSSQVTIELRRNVIDWDTELSTRRAGFYDSLGLFAISLAVPILADGLYRNNFLTLYGIQTYPGETVMSYDDYLRVAYEQQTYNLTRAAGIVISVLAFVDAAIKLDFYLRAADYVAGHQ